MSKTNSEIHNRPPHVLNLNFHCPSFKKNTEEGQTFSMRMIRNWNELYYYFVLFISNIWA